MMPYAKAVSAKTHDFDTLTGEETHTDYERMLGIVKECRLPGLGGHRVRGRRHDVPKPVSVLPSNSCVSAGAKV